MFVGTRKALLSSGANWALRGSSLDLDFVHNRAAVNGANASLTSLLSNTNSTGGYVTNADNSLTLIPANTLRIGAGTGLLVEQASTDVASHANARDFTNAVWVKVNVTAAKNQVGADGTANGASSLTATSNGGTVLQTPGLISAARTFSLYIKRITGSGTVKVTIDGTNYSADLSASLSTAVYYRATITATVIPIIGVQLGTSGDAVAVDFAQLEALAFATSAIPSGSATRSLDLVTLNNYALFNATKGFSYYMYVAPTLDQVNTHYILMSGQRYFYNIAGAGTVVRNLDAGSNSLAATLGSGSLYTTNVKMAGTMTASGRALVANGGTVVTDSFLQPTATGIWIGSATGAGPMNAYTKRLAVMAPISNAALQALTTNP